MLAGKLNTKLTIFAGLAGWLHISAKGIYIYEIDAWLVNKLLIVKGAIEVLALDRIISLLCQSNANFSDAVCVEPSNVLSKHSLKILESNPVRLAMRGRQPKHHLTISDNQNADTDNYNVPQSSAHNSNATIYPATVVLFLGGLHVLTVI